MGHLRADRGEYRRFLLSLTSATAATGTASLAQLCRQEAFYDRYAAIPVELVYNRPLAPAQDGRIGVGERGPGCVLDRPS